MLLARQADRRHKEIGGRHRALSRYYMILNRMKNTHRPKNKSYRYLDLSLDKEEFIEWFMENDFKECSVDRIDNSIGYRLDNLQLIPMIDNIRKDSIKAVNGYCECYSCKISKPLDDMAKDKRRLNGRATICKKCDNARSKRR